MVSCTAPDRSLFAPLFFPGCSQLIAAKWVAVPSALLSLLRFRCLGCSSCNDMEGTITFLLVVYLQVFCPGAVFSALYCAVLGDSYYRRIFVSLRVEPDVFSFATELAEWCQSCSYPGGMASLLLRLASLRRVCYDASGWRLSETDFEGHVIFSVTTVCAARLILRVL